MSKELRSVTPPSRSIGSETLRKSKVIFKFTLLHEIVLVQLALNEYFQFMCFTPYAVFLLPFSIRLSFPK